MHSLVSSRAPSRIAATLLMAVCPPAATAAPAREFSAPDTADPVGRIRGVD
jgi:hypothetical protein